jgi:hypothetical protein
MEFSPGPKEYSLLKAQAVTIKSSAKNRPALRQVFKAKKVADCCYSRVQEAGQRFS